MDDDTPDLDCVRRLNSGDPDSLGVLAGRYERSMLGLARGLLNGDAELACDAVQDTWLRVMRYASGFEERSSVKTWLFRILVNCCHTLRTRTGRDAARDAAPRPDPDGTAALPDDDVDDLRAAVGALREPGREAILLCYHSGMTQEQAAEILDVPLGTFKSRVRAAMRDLRARLETEVAP